MPQLNIVLFPSQIFWFLISFASLYIYLRYCAIPKIEHIIGNRVNNISDTLNLVAALEEDALSITQQCAEESERIQEMVDNIYSAAMLEHQRYRQNIFKKLDDDIKATQESNMLEIQKAKQEFMAIADDAIANHAMFVITATTKTIPDVNELKRYYYNISHRGQ